MVSLIVVLAIATGVFVACGGGKDEGDSVKLIDFPATQTVEPQRLGDTYELRRTVKDEAGKSYDLTATVKTAAGESVNVVSARFELTSGGGTLLRIPRRSGAVSALRLSPFRVTTAMRPT